MPLIFLAAALLGFLMLTGCQTDPVRISDPLLSPLADHKPPVVAMTYPFDGDSLSGLVVVTTDATDKFGVDSVEFFIDGSKQTYGTDTTEPYKFSWDTRLFANGGHVLYARATDPSENSAFSDTLFVTLVNVTPPEETRVIVLLIDGARYSETFGDPARANVPFMHTYMRPQGTLFANFRNEGITRTNPGHASVESGTWQNISNDGATRPTRPTFFEYLRSERAVEQDETYVVVGKSKLDICSYSTHAEYGAAYGASVDAADRSDEATFQALRSHLETDQPKLVLANFAAVDRAGHTGVWNDYIAAIQTADSLVYELWQFLESDDFYAGKTILFITNDHGRHTTDFRSHGDSCEGCEHIMCLVLGPDVTADHTITETRTMVDLCPTIGLTMNFSSPYSSGVPIADLFFSPASGILAAGR
jgi:hypothetical protein